MIPFVKLLEADIGLALVPFLRLQALLRFMAVNQRCSKLALFQLLQHRPPISEHSATICRSILGMPRAVVAATNLSVLPPAAAEVIIQKEHGIDVLSEPCFSHFLPQINEEAYHDWFSMAPSPQYGVLDRIADYAKTDAEDCAAFVAMIEGDAKYWKTSRVNGDFMLLFDRPDGTIVVSEDLQQVYLVSSMGHGGEEMHGGEEEETLDVHSAEEEETLASMQPPTLPVGHGRVLGMMMSATMIPLQGRIVFDGVLVPQPAPSPALIQQAIRAYEHAFNTNQLITVLPKIPPPERVPVQVPSSAAAIAALRAKHAAAVQAIVKYPINEKITYLCAVEKAKDLSGANPQELRNALVVVHCIKGQSVRDGTLLCVQCLQTPEPTLDDYMSIMLDIATKQQERPTGINVDNAQGFHLLELLLKPHGMDVVYVTPWGPRERAIKSFPKCNVCSALHCADGSPLLRCAACSLICYCSRKHQKEDWKDHKAFCMRYRM